MYDGMCNIVAWKEKLWHDVTNALTFSKGILYHPSCFHTFTPCPDCLHSITPCLEANTKCQHDDEKAKNKQTYTNHCKHYCYEHYYYHSNCDNDYNCIDNIIISEVIIMLVKRDQREKYIQIVTAIIMVIITVRII